MKRDEVIDLLRDHGISRDEVLIRIDDPRIGGLYHVDAIRPGTGGSYANAIIIDLGDRVR